MLEKLQEIYNNVTGTTDHILTPQTKIKDFNLSSFGLMQLICAIEDEYDIEIMNSALKKFKTVKNVIDYIESEI